MDEPMLDDQQGLIYTHPGQKYKNTLKNEEKDIVYINMKKFELIF